MSNTGYSLAVLVAAGIVGYIVGHSDGAQEYLDTYGADSGITIAMDTDDGAVWDHTVEDYPERWREQLTEQVNRAARYIQENPGSEVEIHCGPGACTPIEFSNDHIGYDTLDY